MGTHASKHPRTDAAWVWSAGFSSAARAANGKVSAAARAVVTIGLSDDMVKSPFIVKIGDRIGRG